MRLRSRSSPISNSRRASRPTTKKNSAISPSFTQWRRSSDSVQEPSRISRWAVQNDSYVDGDRFAHASATSAPPSRKTALPAWFSTNIRTGDERLRAQALRSANAGWAVSAMPVWLPRFVSSSVPGTQDDTGSFGQRLGRAIGVLGGVVEVEGEPPRARPRRRPDPRRGQPLARALGRDADDRRVRRLHPEMAAEPVRERQVVRGDRRDADLLQELERRQRALPAQPRRRDVEP